MSGVHLAKGHCPAPGRVGFWRGLEDQTILLLGAWLLLFGAWLHGDAAQLGFIATVIGALLVSANMLIRLAGRVTDELRITEQAFDLVLGLALIVSPWILCGVPPVLLTLNVVAAGTLLVLLCVVQEVWER